MDKPTVLYVLKSSVYAGAETVAVTLIHGLQSGYHILYTSADGSIAQRLKKEKIAFKPMKGFSFSELKKIIAETRPDIIHAHDYSAGIFCAILKKRAKLIVHLHHKAPFSVSWKGLVFRAALFRIDWLMLVSASLLEPMGFLRKRHNWVIRENPVDREKIIRLSGGASKKYDLVFIGRLCGEKNPNRFFRILKRFEKEYGSFSAVVIGDGPLREECRQMVAEFCDGSVEMAGYQDNPYRVLSQSRILVMTSIEEGSGLAVMEANVLGVPALATPVGNMESLFGKGAKEICRSDEEFCRKIRMLLQDEAQYEQWKQDALRRSEGFETPDSYIKKIDGLYKRLLHGNKHTLFL